MRLGIFFLVMTMAGCSTAPYRYEPFTPSMLGPQAESQSAGDVTVTAAVPSPAQAEALFGFPIYQRGIQPVWLSVENNSTSRLRYAPTGTDRDYFSPLEVAYMHRKGYSKEARKEMEWRLFEIGMPRIIDKGETRSGFVFTNESPGTKNLLVDLFSAGENHSFMFFLDIPGFVPDHAEFDFRALYEPAEVQTFDLEGFRQMLTAWPCCTMNHHGEPGGLPVAIALVGQGHEILHALLRAGWNETEWTSDREEFDPARAHYLFGRLPDSVFRFKRKGQARNELLVWLSPWLVEGKNVWMAQIFHFVDRRTQMKSVLFGARFDPDMDDGRNYLLQNLWYTQGLEQHGWLDYGDAASIGKAREDFLGASYFTDGYRSVMWLSGERVSMLETRRLHWDEPPKWSKD